MDRQIVLQNPGIKPFLGIIETAKTTGLSTYFIRQGIREGWIPFIRCGNKAMINMKLFLPMLDDLSREEVKAE